MTLFSTQEIVSQVITPVVLSNVGKIGLRVRKSKNECEEAEEEKLNEDRKREREREGSN